MDKGTSTSTVSQVFELYEQIFTPKLSGKSLSDCCSVLKSLWDQLRLLQDCPFTTDLAQHQRHWEDFMVASLLSGLDLHGFKDHILASETLSTTVNACSRLFHRSLR